MSNSRIKDPGLHSKIMTAEEAASLIKNGMNIGMSGFTGAGYPKEVPLELANLITKTHAAGKPFRIGVWTGASTAPELDGALASVDGIELRLPYQSDPISRKKINEGKMEYIDIHLSHVAQFVRHGFFGKLDVALIEVSSITEDGFLVPSSSVGNNLTWIEEADHVIIEVNSWHNEKLEGMHDLFTDRSVPYRLPIVITHPSQRIGTTTINCPHEKIIAIVETNSPDRNTPFTPPDEGSERIAGHILEFLSHEIKKGRIPANLLPIQSGVGNIANAVLSGINKGPFENLTSYTEVIQDGMLELIKSGKMTIASATAFSLSPDKMAEMNKNMEDFQHKIILRPQEISNHPSAIRQMGIIAMNAMIEADIYGNVNSTHIMASKIQNGIGGSGDFARNGYVSIFMAPSIAKNGLISTIVPMVSHVDHTEHDVQVIVTNEGLADLRGLSPRKRAQLIIENCAHPDYKPLLREYYNKANQVAYGRQTPHILDEALSFHSRFVKNGSMKL